MNIRTKILKKLRPKREESKSILKKRFRDVYIHPESSISQHVNIGFGTRINGPANLSGHSEAPIKIGKYCAIAHNFRIRTRNHHTGYPNLLDALQRENGFEIHAIFKGPVIIGHNVWIGDNVTILSGVTVGDGACIGAGAIVTKDIPACSIAVGSPAKVIRERFSERIIKQFLEIQWWDWSADRIKRNKMFFESDLSSNEDIDLFQLIKD